MGPNLTVWLVSDRYKGDYMETAFFIRVLVVGFDSVGQLFCGYDGCPLFKVKIEIEIKVKVEIKNKNKDFYKW
jgi:hypothetical protein